MSESSILYSLDDKKIVHQYDHQFKYLVGDSGAYQSALKLKYS